MRVRSFIIIRIEEGHLKSLSTVQLLVLMLNKEMNGVIRQTVKQVMPALIAILERNNSFIQKYINQQNVMICSKQIIAQEDLFVLLHMLTVSL